MGRTRGSMAWGWEWDLEVMFFFFVFFFLKNDILFSLQSRTKDLTHNVRGLCPRLSIHVSSVYCSKIDVILNLHSPSPCLYAKYLSVLISKVYLIRVLSFIGDLRFDVRGEHLPGCMGRG